MMDIEWMIMLLVDKIFTILAILTMHEYIHEEVLVNCHSWYVRYINKS